MKKGFCALWALLLPLTLSAGISPVVKETLYQEYKESILRSPKHLFLQPTAIQQSLYVDALWDLVEENNPEALHKLAQITPVGLDLENKLRLGILKLNSGLAHSLSESLAEELRNVLTQPEAPEIVVYLLASYAEELKALHPELIELALSHQVAQNLTVETGTVDDAVVADLFNHQPEREGVTLYMFCRQSRLHPCLMVMRDLRGEVVRKADGSLWANKALASSARGLPAHVRNGNTPAGVHLIDSVMPVADQQVSFGKFRRLILEFVPKSADEETLKALLPESSRDQKWWLPSVVARDIGRDLLRIHGTGKINEDPKSLWYPFVRTSGCIAQRENTYEGVTYKDQRNLLDVMMASLDLEAVYANETKIKGTLFLLDLDDKEAPVTERDLMARGIQ